MVSLIVPAFVVLMGLIVYQGIFIWFMYRGHKEREKELLDRIMARDYGQYAQAELLRTEAEKPKPPMVYEEPGIPVT